MLPLGTENMLKTALFAPECAEHSICTHPAENHAGPTWSWELLPVAVQQFLLLSCPNANGTAVTPPSGQ